MRKRDLTEEKRSLASLQGVAAAAERPLLLFLTGAPGAGKTTVYESKLRESFPIVLKSSPSPLEQGEMERQLKELLNSQKSFVFQSSAMDMRLLKEARSHGFEIKAVFIGTEHPDLNIARILSRVSRGGLFGPIAVLHQEYEESLRQLKNIPGVVDELLLVDNTAEGRCPRMIAQFSNGGIVKLSRSMPQWVERVFAKDLDKWLARDRSVSREHTR